MKYLLFIFCFINFAFRSLNDYANDFDRKLSDIASDFKRDIFDVGKCVLLKNDAGDLSNDIETAMNEDEVSETEKTKLKALKIEANALENYISAVGDFGTGYPTIDEFLLANKRVGGLIATISTDKFCMDIVSVTIGDYICYLAQNNTETTLSLSYKWKSSDGMQLGNGTMGVYGKSLRQMYSNRNKPSVKRVSFFGLTCKAI
jgi:hypothetical protein